MARGPLRIARAAHPRTVKHLGPGSLDFALRRVRGGKRGVMEELAPLAMQFEPRLNGSPEMAALTPWQRRFVTLDDLAAEAGMTKGEFLGRFTRVFRVHREITDLPWPVPPQALSARAQAGPTPNGFADRQLFLEHFGALSMRMALEAAAEKARRVAGTNHTGRNGPG